MTFDAQAALSVAARIADHLCDTAFRHGDRCTWMGMTQDAEDGSDQVDFTYGTLGPDLYGGSSGVALFLAEACRRSRDRRWRDTALAAIGHALDRLDTIPPPARAGFYTGEVGVAYAAAMIGRSLERSDLEARLDRAARPPERGGGWRSGGRPPHRRHWSDCSAAGAGHPARPPGVPRSRDAAGPPDGCGRDQKRRRVVMAGIGGHRGLPPAHRAGARGRGHRVVAARAGHRHRRRRDDRGGASRPSATRTDGFARRRTTGRTSGRRTATTHRRVWPGVTGRRGSGSPACVRSSSDSMLTGRMPKRRFGPPDPPWPTAMAGSMAISPSVMVVPGWERFFATRLACSASPRLEELVWEAAAAGAARFADDPAELALWRSAGQQPVADDRARRHRVLLPRAGRPGAALGAPGAAAGPGYLARCETPASTLSERRGCVEAWLLRCAQDDSRVRRLAYRHVPQLPSRCPAQRRGPRGGDDGLERRIAAGPQIGDPRVHPCRRLGLPEPLVGASPFQQQHDVPGKRRARDLAVEPGARLAKRPASLRRRIAV